MMKTLADLWKQFCDFFGIEVAESIVPETKEPPKPYEPVESVTPLPEKPIAEAPIEEIQPLPSEHVSEPTPIGEQGRADRIEVLPAKEEPEFPTAWAKNVTFSIVRGNGVRTAETGNPVSGVQVSLYARETREISREKLVGSCVTGSGGSCKITNLQQKKSFWLDLEKTGYKTNTLLFTTTDEPEQKEDYYIHKEA